MGGPLPEDWAEALRRRLYDGPVGDTLARIYGWGEPRDGVHARSDVFPAFHLTEPKDARVILLAQDPHPLPAHHRR